MKHRFLSGRGAFLGAGVLACAISLAVLPAGAAQRPERATAPLGFQIMCLKYPSQCQGGGQPVVQLSQSGYSVLRQINTQVNRSIRPRFDGLGDVWTPNARTGDCEEYVLAKRAALIGAGFPPSALRIAHVRTRAGQGHAILVLRTTSGDLVLDNLSPSVRRLQQTGYRIVAMSTENPLIWF